MRRSLRHPGKLSLALFTVALLVLVLVALAACAKSTAPTLQITAPVSGSTLPAGNILVTVQVTNFDLVNKLSQPNVAGQGHIHYFLDYPAPTTQGQPAIPPASANATWVATPDTSYTFNNVVAGSHTIYVELVNNDHTPLNPPVVESVTFTVSAHPPVSTPTPTVAPATTPTPTSTPTTTPTVAPTATPTIAPTATPTVAPTATPTTTAQSVTINLIAHNIAFNLSTITVPACADVTINFDNEDVGIPHNFALYTNSSATTVLFTGPVITGPATTTYHFTAPCTPGTYFFRCDIHPTIMFGNFVVTSS